MITRSRILALIAVVAAIFFGYRLQRQRPDEKSRLHHPQAYSVCVPDGWSGDVDYGHGEERLANAAREDGLMLMPDHFAGTPPRLSINRFKGVPDPQALRSDGWVDGVFQGQPAFVREKKFAHSYSRGAVFERSGQWFEVVEGLSVAGSLQSDDWWQYLETFRYPDGTPPAVRDLPTTAPESTAPFSLPAVGQ